MTLPARPPVLPGKCYIAKMQHAKDCALCETPILPGDKCQGWSWWDYEGVGGKFGGFTRVHWTCALIAYGSREGDLRWDEQWMSFQQWDEEQDDSLEATGGYPTMKRAARHLQRWRRQWADIMTVANLVAINRERDAEIQSLRARLDEQCQTTARMRSERDSARNECEEITRLRNDWRKTARQETRRAMIAEKRLAEWESVDAEDRDLSDCFAMDREDAEARLPDGDV